MKDGSDREQRKERETHEKRSIIPSTANEKQHTLCDPSPIDDFSL